MVHLTEVLELPVYDSRGKKIGRVVELAASPTAEPPRVTHVLVKDGKNIPVRSVVWEDVASFSTDRMNLRVPEAEIQAFQPDDSFLLLRKDLLDQQIIDVHGRKVVRVNDLSLQESLADHPELRLAAVNIGLAGALRRLFVGVLPRAWVRKLGSQVKPSVIPWAFVNLLEPDPLRRVKLRLSHKVLARLHPADLADIVEKLSPKDRKAIFADLDDATVADALSEIQRKLQAAILDSLDAARAADIVEEMSPDAAADLLANLPEEKTSALLQGMAQEEAEELGELLEFPEHSAGGLMTTEYVAMPSSASVREVRNLLARLPEFPETLTTIFLVDEDGKWAGSVPVGKLLVTSAEDALIGLRSEPPLSIPVQESERDVFELFDKYNLLALPVVDEENRLAGVVTVDDVITVLRKQS